MYEGTQMKSNFLTGEKIAAMDHLEDQLIFFLYFKSQLQNEN